MCVFAAIRLFMPRHTFAFVALALVLAILGVLGYKLSPLLFARADALLPPTSCNPAETPCSAALPDGGRVVLSAAPRPIRPLQPLRLYVHLIGTQAETVEIDFDGDWEDGLSDTKDDDDFVSLEVEALPLTIEQAETAPISEVRRFLRRYSLGSNATEDVAREMAAAFIETYNEV